ncbi:MAG: DNA primase [Clostridia bacterium]|nr:DNA primase [Clostridia bacterium]
MARYSDEVIDEIKSANDIVDVISQYVVLKRSGRNFFGLCPFHKEKSPSFSVSPDKQIFHCFGCGVGGNVIHFVSKIENMNFIETLQMLAERSNITLPNLDGNLEDTKTLELKSKIYKINELTAEFYHQNLYNSNSKPAQEYVKKRKLDNKTLKKFLIGYSMQHDELYKYLLSQGFTEDEILKSNLVYKNPNGQIIDRFRRRLMFPIFDIKNRVIAFGGRVLDDSKPKYINSSEGIVYSKGRNLYGLNLAKNSGKKEIIIVEGYMDAVSLHQRGIDNVVASLGTALTEAQGRLLTRYSEKVIIGYDSDGAGQAATLRGLEILNNMGCDLRILQMEGAKDPDEYVIKYGTGKFNLLVEQAISLVEFKIKILKNDLNLDNTNDKIKFLNEIAKILSKVSSKLEQEVYIEKISKEYDISKEAIYAQINKMLNSNNKGIKTLEKRQITKINTENQRLDEKTIKREKTLIWLLINNPEETYSAVHNLILEKDIKDEQNRKIVTKLYEQYENGNSNINSLLDILEEQDVSYITGIMAENLEISDINKGIYDILLAYEREKLIIEKENIIKQLENPEIDVEESKKLGEKLRKIMAKLAK